MKSLQFFSNFNLELLTRFVSVKNSETFEVIDNSMSTLNSLIKEEFHDEANEAELAFVWFSPESISPSFQQALNGEKYSFQKILEEFENFFKIILHLRKSFKSLAIPLFHQFSSDRNYGILDLRNNLGIKNILLKLNSRMIDTFEKDEDIFILDPYSWIRSDSFSPKMWYSAKVPFTNDVFKTIAADIDSLLIAKEGKTKKLVVLDLDNTLWGGVVGDDGWENLRLGGHDHLGEAFVEFQKKILNISKKGILLSICSKNTESVALEAISKHPEMILDIDDFSSYRINWNDKAANIKSICEELNIGTQSVVFIDDNINERERVKSALPEVFVPDLPKDPRMYSSFFTSLREFDAYSFTDEDRNRKLMYQQRKAEKEDLQKETEMLSLDEWLMSLEIEVKAESLNEINLTRTSQLLNKTNQMNLTTRRMTKEELESWVDAEDNYLWTFRTSDKFGDSGLTGIASLTLEEDEATIIDFILSCRVMGKEIENSMLFFIIKYLKDKGVNRLKAKLIPTEKNKPCLDFFSQSQLEMREENEFYFDLVHDFEKPKPVKVIFLENE